MAARALVSTAIALAASTGGFAFSATPPLPKAADFSARVGNPWYPLIAGTTYVYRGVKDGHPSREVMTARTRSK